MKKVYLIDYIGYVAVKLLGALARALPLGFALWLGRRAGDAAFFLNMERRAIGYANLKAALGDKIPPKERLCVIRGEYRNLCESFMEVLRFPIMDERYANRYIKFENGARITEALNKGRGVILITAHFGNWELSGVAAAMKGYPLRVLAR